jgi:hypothetical protein
MDGPESSKLEIYKKKNKRKGVSKNDAKPRSNLAFGEMKQKVSESDARQVLGGFTVELLDPDAYKLTFAGR